MMKEGLLWYDDDPKCALGDKVMRAARRYRQKHGVAPNVCYVHRSLADESADHEDIGGVHVEALASVLRNHYWIGTEESGTGLSAHRRDFGDEQVEG